MNKADKRILAHFSAIRRVTIELLRRVPEEMLARKGNGDESTIGRVFLHVAGGQSWWLQNVIREGGGFIEDRQGSAARAAVLQALEETHERMASFFSSADEDRMGKTYCQGKKEPAHIGRDVVLYLTAHEVHHVGRIVAALRQLGFDNIPFMPREQPADGG